MHPATARQIELGLIEATTQADGSIRLTHRTLSEASRWRVSVNKEQRRDVVKELFDRLSKGCGKREVARLEHVIKTLPLDMAR